MNKSALKQIIFRVYAIGMFITTFILLTPTSLFDTPSTGLDASWHIGIHLAVKNNFVFGKDFIFTYGPLGYLVTRLPIGISKVHLIVWDTFILANIAFILFYIFRRLHSYLVIFFVFLTVLILNLWPIYTTPLVTLLFLIFEFMLFHYLNHNHIFTLVIASLISLLAFYIKMNMGIPMLGLMLLFLIYLYIYPTTYPRKFILVYIFGFLLLGYISSWVLNTDLVDYVQGSLHLANSYNDAMFLDVGKHVGIEKLYLALTIMLSFSLVFLANFKTLIGHKNSLLTFSFTTIFIFLLFKQGFVRADQLHILFFFHAIPAAVGLLCLFSPPSLSPHISKVLVIALICSFPFATGLYRFEYILTRYQHVESYVAALFAPTPSQTSTPELESQRLPTEVLQIIGDKTVDIMLWDISYIYINDLSYNPRPIIQSYCAYDDYLDTRNYEKYISNTAPDFILFLPNDIDGRYPMFTEAKTRLALLTHYEVIDRFGEFLLFRKLDQPVPTSIKISKTGEAKLGEFIDLDNSDDLQYMTVAIEYSLAGKIIRTFYQPPELKVTVQFANGEEKSFRAIKSIINGEVLVNKFVYSFDSIGAYFKSKGKLSEQVKRIRFDTPHPWGFQPDFSYQIKSVTLNYPSAVN